MEYFERVCNWTLKLQPVWVGFVVFITCAMALVATFIFSVVGLILLTNGWILLGIPVLVLYAFYAALFKQPKG